MYIFLYQSINQFIGITSIMKATTKLFRWKWVVPLTIIIKHACHKLRHKVKKFTCVLLNMQLL